MIRVRVTMDLDCPGMGAAEATAHAVAVAEAAGFTNPLPTPGVKGSTTPRNWWRELVHETWSDADAAWCEQRERATFLYETETAEWEEANPRPTMKAVMQGLSGSVDRDTITAEDAGVDAFERMGV